MVASEVAKAKITTGGGAVRWREGFAPAFSPVCSHTVKTSAYSLLVRADVVPQLPPSHLFESSTPETLPSIVQASNIAIPSSPVVFTGLDKEKSFMIPVELEVDPLQYLSVQVKRKASGAEKNGGGAVQNRNGSRTGCKMVVQGQMKGFLLHSFLSKREEAEREEAPVIQLAPLATPPAETPTAIRWAARNQARSEREALVPLPLSPVIEPPPSPVVTPPLSPVVTPPLSPVVTQLPSPVVQSPPPSPVVQSLPPPLLVTPLPPQPPPPVVTQPPPLVVTQPPPPVVTQPPTPVVTQPPPPVVTQPPTPVVTQPVEPTGGEGASGLGGGDFSGEGSGPDFEDSSSEEEVPTRARARRSQPTVPTRARALRSQPTEFDFSRDSLEEIGQKIRTERENIKCKILEISKKLLSTGISSASLLDAMFDDFPTSHSPIEKEKLVSGRIFPHYIKVEEVIVGGKEMLEASIVTKKDSVATREWVALMKRLQPLSMKLAALEARAAELERTAELERNPPPPEPPRRQSPGKDSQDEEVIKPYTPTTLDSDLGHFDLVIKVYETDNSKTRVVRGKDSQDEEVIKPYTPTTLDSDLGHFDLVIKGRGRYVPGRAREIGMLAADYGITPMFRVARAILENLEDTTKVHLIYANDTCEDILLKDELDHLTANYPDRIKIYYVLNKPPEGWNGDVGFVSKKMIQTHCPAPAADILIWMCGPPPMIPAETLANLVALGHRNLFQF
ncbi:hypothetical protein RHGRI_023033 [Rhododendron griersonianum]|uniref:FAD-binding FR-type domain-containing protein n=1 Tax=Rhododendron griersonianum TaxID=479676 RepID=A0AAV6J3P6_9ERIC|nr:hypothetical protein RHGRI_023033 [Rhododendron griersonianum]